MGKIPISQRDIQFVTRIRNNVIPLPAKSLAPGSKGDVYTILYVVIRLDIQQAIAHHIASTPNVVLYRVVAVG